VLLFACGAFAAGADAPRRATWAETAAAARARLAEAGARAQPLGVWLELQRGFPIECDWLLQDLAACGFPCAPPGPDAGRYPLRWCGGQSEPDVEQKLIARVADELGPAGEPIRKDSARLAAAQAPPRAQAWLDLYAAACQLRRQQRLRAMIENGPQIVFTKHFNMGGSHYAYTEAQSDAQAERHFTPGAALCLLEMDGATPKVRTLLEDPHGVIRDPDVSYDGRRVLFAWKQSDRLDDYHLHELDLATGKVRQLTFGLGFADYECGYLPDGGIIFNSTRCVQTVDCFTTEVSNLYACDGDGRFLRRVAFDQVHSNFPTVTEDGRVLYTRWEYNDRGQIYPQALFQMNADGTNQTEFYGNNSYFPTTILHARQIGGTQKVVAIATGHHSRQTGKLLLLDPARGRQENAGAQLLAPARDTPAVKVDAYGQEGDLFQYPYPLSETEFLVTYSPWGWAQKPLLLGVYWMAADGRRELLASDPHVSCNQPIPVRRAAPRSRPSLVDYRKTTGTFYMQDVYAGSGLAGVPRGAARKLRVVALDFRAALIGGNGNRGEAGAAFVATPVALSNGCWDAKIVLGETPIYADGSAFFTVPARTPVYFQALDERNHVIQTMRSWSQLQPGENAACVGCHESKNSTPQFGGTTEALRRGPLPLAEFYGPPRGFSFRKEIQPILNRHCIRCHRDRSQLPVGVDEPPDDRPAADGKPQKLAFSMLPEETEDPRAKRRFSDAYLALTGAVRAGEKAFEGVSRPTLNWMSPQSGPPQRAPYSAGAARSAVLEMLARGHNYVQLSREEFDKLACWIDLVIPYCGDYFEANAWTPQEQQRYEHFLAKRRRMEAVEAENIRQYLAAAGHAAAPLRDRPDFRGAAADNGTVPLGSPQPRLLTLEVVAADGAALAKAEGRPTPQGSLACDLPRGFRPGDRLRIGGAKHVAVQLDPQLGEARLFLPDGAGELPLPAADAPAKATPYPPGAFRADRPRVTVRPLALGELDAYRNLALNPYDAAAATTVFPHATANSECRGEAVFAARNALDGFRRNEGHGGWPFQSWGPEKTTDAEWQVVFGRTVQVDKIVIVLRADFPHDGHWRQTTLVFSDGARQVVRLEATGRPQSFAFPARQTTSLRLAELRQDGPPGWCALAEVEVWGRDPLPVAENLAAAAP
jgi:hypothetical protein